MDPGGTSEGLLPGKTNALKMQVFNLESTRMGTKALSQRVPGTFLTPWPTQNTGNESVFVLKVERHQSKGGCFMPACLRQENQKVKARLNYVVSLRPA